MSISEQLNLALREWVAIFMRRSMHEFLRLRRESSISMAQLRTLMHLHFHGVCQISDIGIDLDVSAPAASQMVDRLVNMGFMERAEDPEDRRVKRINITERGRELVHNGIEARLKWMQDLANNLTPKQQSEILNALRTLTDAALELEEQHPADEIVSQRINI